MENSSTEMYRIKYFTYFKKLNLNQHICRETKIFSHKFDLIICSQLAGKTIDKDKIEKVFI